jgi:hypothetical protein
MPHQDLSNVKNPHRFSKTNQPYDENGNFKGGRKKGIPNFSTIFKRYLKQIVELKKGKDTEETVQVTAQEAMVIRAIEKAISTGDVNRCEMIMNRVDGLPKQEIKNTGKEPLQIMFTQKSKEDLEDLDNFETNMDDKEEDLEKE